MSCNNPEHSITDHVWPRAGHLDIQHCERYCRYCPRQAGANASLNNALKFENAGRLRKHVKVTHLARGPLYGNVVLIAGVGGRARTGISASLTHIAPAAGPALSQSLDNEQSPGWSPQAGPSNQEDTTSPNGRNDKAVTAARSPVMLPSSAAGPEPTERNEHRVSMLTLSKVKLLKERWKEQNTNFALAGEILQQVVADGEHIGRQYDDLIAKLERQTRFTKQGKEVQAGTSRASSTGLGTSVLRKKDKEVENSTAQSAIPGSRTTRTLSASTSASGLNPAGPTTVDEGSDMDMYDSDGDIAFD